MNRHDDIEETLKNFRHDPAPDVKRSVMSAYERSIRGRSGGPGAVPFWRRPIPLYLAAGALAVMIAVSFVAGRQTSSHEAATALSHPSEGAASRSEDTELEWAVAERDLL